MSRYMIGMGITQTNKTSSRFTSIPPSSVYLDLLEISRLTPQSGADLPQHLEGDPLGALHSHESEVTNHASKSQGFHLLRNRLVILRRHPDRLDPFAAQALDDGQGYPRWRAAREDDPLRVTRPGDCPGNEPG